MISCLRTVILVAILFGQSATHAKLTIELEVATEPGLSLTAPQRWAKMLGQLDLASVRLRSIRSGERPEITSVELGGRTHHRVLAVLTRREELLLAQGRFGIHDQKALKVFFEKLSSAPPDSGAPRGRFDLTEKEFQAIYADLARPVGFATKAKTTPQLLTDLEKLFAVPVVPRETTNAQGSKPLNIELSQFSAGTALAIALRRDGLMLVPEKLPAGGLQLTVAPYDPQRESWPVGWKAEASPRQVAPPLYESLTIEIGNYTLQQALEALAPRISVPVIFDDWILAKRNINPDKIPVKLARQKTFLKRAINRMLSQARLAGEVRVDEAGQPFLWVTQFGKDSSRAAQ